MHFPTLTTTAITMSLVSVANAAPAAKSTHHFTSEDSKLTERFRNEAQLHGVMCNGLRVGDPVPKGAECINAEMPNGDLIWVPKNIEPKKKYPSVADCYNDLHVEHFLQGTPRILIQRMHEARCWLTVSPYAPVNPPHPTSSTRRSPENLRLPAGEMKKSESDLMNEWMDKVNNFTRCVDAKQESCPHPPPCPVTKICNALDQLFKPEQPANQLATRDIGKRWNFLDSVGRAMDSGVCLVTFGLLSCPKNNPWKVSVDYSHLPVDKRPEWLKKLNAHQKPGTKPSEKPTQKSTQKATQKSPRSSWEPPDGITKFYHDIEGPFEGGHDRGKRAATIELTPSNTAEVNDIESRFVCSPDGEDPYMIPCPDAAGFNPCVGGNHPWVCLLGDASELKDGKALEEVSEASILGATDHSN